MTLHALRKSDAASAVLLAWPKHLTALQEAGMQITGCIR